MAINKLNYDVFQIIYPFNSLNDLLWNAVKTKWYYLNIYSGNTI